MALDEQALEREHDRIGVERRAVVKPHVRTQVERPAQAVLGDLPLRRETRLDVGRPRLPADEPLEEQLADLDRLAVGRADRIEHDHVGGLRDDERTRIAALVQRLAFGVTAHPDQRGR